MSILKRNSFDTKYPMFVTIITDEYLRKNMMENSDLMEKCSKLKTSITIFLNELDQHFDTETQMDIIVNSIFKYPTEVLAEFITAYLNSELYVKCNSDIVKYFNKILRYGEDCIRYVSKNGIIINSKRYNNLPSEVINEMFNDIVNNNIVFKEELVFNHKQDFTDEEKKYIIDLVENNCWQYIINCFGKYDISVVNLIKTLYNATVNVSILNTELCNMLGDDIFNALIVQLFISNSSVVTENVYELVNMNKINELKYIVLSDNIKNLIYIDKLMIPTYDLNDMIDVIDKANKVLVKEDK